MAVAAIAAALRPLRELLGSREDLPDPTIPVDRAAWSSCLQDAGVAELPGAIGGLVARILAEAGPSMNYASLRRTADSVCTELEPIVAKVACLAAFVPAGEDGPALARAVVAALDAACGVIVGQTAGGDVDAAARGLSDIVARLGAVAAPSGTDVWLDAFGVRGDQLCPMPAPVATSRLLAAFHGRYGELADHLGTLMSSVSDARMDIVKEARLARGLLDSPRPLVTLSIARAVRSLIVDEYDARPEPTATVLIELLMRVNNSYENQSAAGRIRDLLAQSEKPRERAVHELDLHRRMVEGQVRPWAWTIARLLGKSAGCRAPELGPLRTMLTAHSDWLAADAVARLSPTLRNAAAHEDYAWDAESCRLVFDGGSTSEDELRRETLNGYAFMCGAEIGWAFARTERQLLGEALDLDPGPARRALLNGANAAAHFGTNGLQLDRFDFNDDALAVEVAELTPETVNPCVQAMMWVSELIPVIDIIEVWVPDTTAPAVTVHRSAFDVMFPLWASARRWFEQMPTSVFVPALTDNRLQVESEGRAAEAAVWFALNAALHAYDEFHDTALPDVRTQLLDLSRLLLLAAESLQATAALLPEQAALLTGRPYKFVRAAAMWARSAADGDESGALFALETRLVNLRDSFRTPAVLPTLWTDTVADRD